MYFTFEDQIAIPCSIYRGGTSKGALFLKKELPQEKKKLSSLLLKIMGSPDVRQIDGLGGADPLTSRVGIISKNSSGEIAFEFALVHVKEPIVEFRGFCGNLISAVGPFALSQGLIEAAEPITQVPIFDVNTQIQVIAEVETKKGKPLTKGDFFLSGVPNPGSKILLRFLKPGGTSLASMLPTGNPCDFLDTSFGRLSVSLVDCMAPSVFVKACDLSLQGNETPQELEKNQTALHRLEEIRLLGAQKMKVDFSGYLPKVVFISSHPQPGAIYARMLALKSMHKAYAVSCGACTAAAAFLSGTIVNQMVTAKNSLRIYHPQGSMEIGVKMSSYIEEISLLRTARCLMCGVAYL